MYLQCSISVGAICVLLPSCGIAHSRVLLPDLLLHMVSGSCMLHPGLLQAVGMPKVLLVSGQCSFSVQDVLMQVRTQLAQRAMSAHDMGVEMTSHEGLSTLESGSNSQSWHAASEPPLDFATCFRVTFTSACMVFCGSVISAQLYCSIKRTSCISTHDDILARRSVFPEESRCDRWSGVHQSSATSCGLCSSA